MRLVYLEGSPDVIRGRLATRQGHFMPAGLLDSQFADLEPPGADEHPITADLRQDPGAIVSQILGTLREHFGKIEAAEARASAAFARRAGC